MPSNLGLNEGWRTAGAFASSRLAGELIFTGELSTRQDAIAGAINARHRQQPIDMVLASDVPGLYCTHDLADRLLPAVYPMPDRKTLDILNDKWSFYRFASARGLPVPKTVFFSHKGVIDVALVGRKVGFPAVVKPVSAWSSLGVRIVVSEDDLTAFIGLAGYPFHGIVVQEYVAGRDVGLAMFARRGEVVATSTFYRGHRDATECADMPQFSAMAAEIARQTSYGGVANFDARRAADGGIRLLECNPRFFMRLRAMRLCGLDLLRFGLPGAHLGGHARGNHYLRSDLFSLGGLGRVLSGKWPAAVLLRDLADAVRDPLPSILRGFHSSKF